MNKRLLIIDDSQIDRKILKNMLFWEFDVTEAENGFRGLELLLSGKQKFDGVLLDLHMPIMDGFHVLQLMRDNGIEGVPVVIITAESTESNLMKSVPFQIADFICKPFDPDLVVPRLKKCFYGE